MKMNPIHVGSLIRAELTRQNQSVTWLAERLGIERTNCYRILGAQSVHTAMLERLSIAMQHDFFADCSTSAHYSFISKQKEL
jgi:plasmid maintenance system antidote protein VapI